MKTSILSVLAISIVLLSSCKKEKSASPSTLNYQFTASNTNTGLVQWTAGSANVSSLTFGTSQSTTNDSSTINKTVDLFASATTALGSLQVSAGTYSNPYLTLQLSSSSSVPSLHLTGTVTDGTTTLPVDVDLTDALKLQGTTSSSTLSSNSSYTAQFTLDLSALTQGLAFSDFSSATQSDNEVLISSSSNTAIYNTIENNIATALTMTIQ